MRIESIRNGYVIRYRDKNGNYYYKTDDALVSFRTTSITLAKIYKTEKMANSIKDKIEEQASEEGTYIYRILNEYSDGNGLEVILTDYALNDRNYNMHINTSKNFNKVTITGTINKYEDDKKKDCEFYEGNDLTDKEKILWAVADALGFNPKEVLNIKNKDIAYKVETTDY